MKPIKTRDFLLDNPDTDPELIRRLEWCGTPTGRRPWSWIFCRTASCHRCRTHRVSEWTAEAVALFERSQPRDLKWVTIMLKPLTDVTTIKPHINASRVDLRNLVHRLRKKDERAHGMRMIGCSEVDWYYVHHVERLSSYKREQLLSTGFDVTAEGVWYPHLHLIVDLAGIPAETFTDRLTRKWGGYRQVDVRPLHAAGDLGFNIGRMLSYATKHKHYYKIDPLRSPSYVRWSRDAIATYHNELFAAGGFNLLRHHLKPMLPSNAAVLTETSEELLPLPFDMSVSEIPYLTYNQLGGMRGLL